MSGTFGPETDSAMPHYAKCVGAAALQRIDSDNEPARMGNAGHHHMRLRGSHGVDYAVEQLRATAERFGLDEAATDVLIARCLKFEWCPPAGALTEVPLVMLMDGRVVRTKGGQGKYELAEPFKLSPGTIDVMWSEPEPLDMSDPERPRCPPGSILWVGDYKFGDAANVDGINDNLQLASAACKAKAWTGAEFVVPVVIFPGPGEGVWDAPDAPWGDAQAAAAERRLLGVLERTVEARRAVARGVVPSLTTGKHCTYCAAKTTCPAKTEIVKSMLGRPITANGLLTADERVWAAEHVSMLESSVRALREALKADVDVNGPIRTRYGTWGANVTQVTSLDMGAAMPVLREVLGEEIAEGMVKKRLPMAALDQGARAAIAAGHRAPSVSALKRRMWAKLEDAGAIRRTEGVEYGMRRHDDVIALMRGEGSE